jgi:hypothetical protein
MGIVQDNFEKAKAWYQSKTIIGLIISTVGAVVFALTAGKVDIQGATNEVLNANEAVVALDQVWSGALFAVGQLVALWGRITAKTNIKL